MSFIFWIWVVFLALSFYSIVSQDYMAYGSQGLFTQVGFHDPLQDDASQSHFAVVNPLCSVSGFLYFQLV